MSGKVCKHDGTTLHKKETRRTSEQLLKQYYFTAYYQCPQCKRIYHDERFKVINTTKNLFNENPSLNFPSDVAIWTDGACVNNGKPNAVAAWGFVSGEHTASGKVEGKQTNNRAEGLAIYHALVWAAGQGHKKVSIYTDSQISIFGVNKLPYLGRKSFIF